MISFIVPAYNEVAHIGATVEAISAAAADSELSEYEIIVVDDGSTDGTGESIRRLQGAFPVVKLISHPENRGLGSAIRSALAAANYAQFMIVPGDNDVRKELLKSMLAFRARADLVLVAPLNKEIRTIWRNLLSMAYQAIYMVSFDVFVNYINGPGIWPTEKAREISLRASRFSIISELNIKLLRSGCAYVEIPGYFQAGPKVRSTVTFRNLVEVIRSYLLLMYEVHFLSRERFSKRSRRAVVEFVDANSQ